MAADTPDPKDAYLKMQRLLAIKKLMAESDYAAPKLQSEIYATRLRGRASQASAAHSLFPMLKESGDTTGLPADMGDMAGILSTAAEAAHGRVVGNYDRKGLLDQSLINRRDTMNKFSQAQTQLTNTRNQYLPLEADARIAHNRSGVTRDLASANMMNVYARLKQSGADDQQAKEALSAAMQYNLDRQENLIARGVPKNQIPPMPSMDELHQQAMEYLTSKRAGIADRTGRGIEDLSQRFTLDGGDISSPTPQRKPMAQGSDMHPALVNFIQAQLAQAGVGSQDGGDEPSLDPGNFDEGGGGQDEGAGVDEGTLQYGPPGINSYNGPDANTPFDEQKMRQMLQALRQNGFLR